MSPSSVPSNPTHSAAGGSRSDSGQEAAEQHRQQQREAAGANARFGVLAAPVSNSQVAATTSPPSGLGRQRFMVALRPASPAIGRAPRRDSRPARRAARRRVRSASRAARRRDQHQSRGDQQRDRSQRARRDESQATSRSMSCNAAARAHRRPGRPHRLTLPAASRTSHWRRATAQSNSTRLASSTTDQITVANGELRTASSRIARRRQT